MLLRRVSCAARRASRTASSALQRHRGTASTALTNGLPQVSWTGAARPGCLATYRELSTSSKMPNIPESEGSGTRAGELLELIERSREEGDTERELAQSLELYDVLKQRSQQDADVFDVAFGIARIYDEQLEDCAAATTYYEEALTILEDISTEVTAWGVYTRVTTLGALAVCYESLEQPEEAEKYFGDAIGAYGEHCEQASALSAGEEDSISEADISLLADLNATAAMIHYHFAGNLLAQERWDEVKAVTKIALVLAENSSMPAEDLEELQQCIHDLWLEMD